MGKLLKNLLKLGAIAAAVAVAIRGLQLYKGSPEGVGGEPFSFEDGLDDDPYAIDESTLGGDVNPELLDRLVCPLDKGPLELEDGKWLVNPRNGYRYPITDGIPVMLVEVGHRYRLEDITSSAPASTPEVTRDLGDVEDA
jgi:uncharacterized protein YbaR (Trm112 family)